MIPFVSFSTILIIMNVITSYRGFKDSHFYEKYLFDVDAILIQKDYKRLITSGFLHSSWTHLILNMLALVFFSGSVESYLGPVRFLIIYLVSLAGGGLLSLFIHRNHGDYTSVGASGAINGIIFASIALFPGIQIGLFILPISPPGWLFGLIYTAISIYGIRSKSSNIGHDAHLGGGLVGVLVAILMVPTILVTNISTIAIITLPATAFILFIFYKPEVLFIDNLFYKNHNYTLEDRYNVNKINHQKELDRLLEKIHRRGMKSLSKKERQALEEYSK